MSDQVRSGCSPIVEPAVGLLRRQHERQVLLAEVVQLGRRRRAADDHQRPRDVVEAVTVLLPRSVTLRMLVQPAGVGEPTQVEVDRRRDLDGRDLRFTDKLDHEASAMLADDRCRRDRAVAVGHRRPQQLGRLQRRLLGQLSSKSGLTEHPAQGRLQRRGVPLWHQEPGPVGQQLDRVREGRGDHRSPGRDRLDEHPGRHLLARVVGQQHHIGLSHQLGQLADAEVAVVELDDVVHTRVPGALRETVAVGLAVALHDLGVAPAHHQVAGLQVAQPDHGVDRPLDALTRSDQSPGEDEGAVDGLLLDRRRGPVVDRAVRDHHDLRRIGSVARDEPSAGGLRQGHDDVGRGEQLQQDVPLRRRRVLKDGVQHDDRRHRQRIDDPQDVDPVRAAVDAVLVLDDHHVEAVEVTDGGTGTVRGAVHQLRHHLRAGSRLGLVDELHHAERPRRELHVLDESGTERRQAALGRRVGADHADRGRAR